MSNARKELIELTKEIVEVQSQLDMEMAKVCPEDIIPDMIRKNRDKLEQLKGMAMIMTLMSDFTGSNSEGDKLLNTEEAVVTLMRSSKSEREWNDNCDMVKQDNGGQYPDFWYPSIVMSGVMAEAQMGWE